MSVGVVIGFFVMCCAEERVRYVVGLSGVVVVEWLPVVIVVFMVLVGSFAEVGEELDQWIKTEQDYDVSAVTLFSCVRVA